MLELWLELGLRTFGVGIQLGEKWGWGELGLRLESSLGRIGVVLGLGRVRAAIRCRGRNQGCEELLLQLGFERVG